jgi:hypothetical protein
MYRIIFYTFLLASLLFMFSCHDEEGAGYPVVEIQFPAPGIEIDIPDTFDVKVKVTDDLNITSVYITIVDEDETELVQRKSYVPQNKVITIETAFSLIDKTLETGTYYIKVTADNGSNTTNEYQEIRVNEIPLKLTGFIAVTSQVGIKSTIYRLNPVFEPDTQFILNETHQLSAVNSNWEDFFFVSNEPSVLTAYSISNFDPAWETGAMPPRAEITAVISDSELIFSTANGDVTILDRNGNIRIRTVAYESKTISHLAADSTYIYAAHVSLSGDIRELSVLYRVTGEIRDQKLLSGEIRGLVAFRGAAYVFMPSANDIAVFLYDPEMMVLTQENIIYNQKLLSAECLDDQQIFLLTESAVFSYNPFNNSFVLFAIEPYELCRYEQLNDDVFLVKDKDVSRFDRVSGELISRKTFQDKVLDFQIIYNK